MWVRQGQLPKLLINRGKPSAEQRYEDTATESWGAHLAQLEAEDHSSYNSAWTNARPTRGTEAREIKARPGSEELPRVFKMPLRRTKRSNSAEAQGHVTQPSHPQPAATVCADHVLV